LNKLSQFWQELKRRKVVRVVSVYAAAAFVILELVSIVVEPLKLPEWFLPAVIVLLCIGFIIAIILSWIYDVKPEGGLIKTDTATSEEIHASPPSSKGWKIVSYVSFVVIVVLIVINIIPRSSPSADALNPGTSIGVLPFENLSGDPEHEHFCVGMTDAVISRLSKINGIGKVPSRTSMTRYKNNEKTIPEIASELGVTYILESGFQKSGNEIKISLNLVDGQSDKALWSEEYSGIYDDIFRIQADVAKIVASKLNVNITVHELADIRKSMTDNVEAYNLYLKGVSELRFYTISGTSRAVKHFENAIALDSTFALAYSGLASCHISRASTHASEINALDALALVKPLVDKALSLDPNLSDAHIWNGFYLLYNNWDFTGAEQEYKKAIIGENPDALLIYADFLNFTSNHDKALEMAERLIKTDPLYPNGRLSMSLFYVGEHEKAIAYAKSRVEMFDNYYSLDSYGFVLLNTGRYERAIEIFNRAIETASVRLPRLIGWMGAAYARMGNTEKSMELIEELKLTVVGSTAFFIAVIYAALDNKPLALEWLQNAYENHEMEIPWLKTEPQLYTLHDEPAFQSLIDKVGFPITGSDFNNN
jgi:TolB-like protein/Tfp pilus assembly protein PilF